MSQDPTEEALAAFHASVKTAATVLAERLNYLATQNVRSVMQRAFDFDPKPQENYKATIGADAVAAFRNPPPKVKIYTADAMLSQAVDFVTRYPGHGVEKIAVRLGVKATDLSRQLNKAVASGKLVRKGYGRASKYHPSRGTLADKAIRRRKRA